jgi:hypothetical protein
MLTDQIDNQAGSVRLKPKAWHLATDQDQQSTGVNKRLDFRVAQDQEMFSRTVQDPHSR